MAKRKYKEGDFKRYIIALIASLIVIAFSISAFIVSITRSEPEDYDEYLIEEIDGVIHVSPGPGLQTPNSPPSLPPPTSPPPEY